VVGDTIVRVFYGKPPHRRPAPVTTHVLKDRDQPRPAVGAGGEAVKGRQRLHQGVLDQILGFAAIPLPPHRQPEQPIDVRHRLRLEGSPVSVR